MACQASIHKNVKIPTARSTGNASWIVSSETNCHQQCTSDHVEKQLVRIALIWKVTTGEAKVEEKAPLRSDPLRTFGNK